jgi:hypothetical protein
MEMNLMGKCLHLLDFGVPEEYSIKSCILRSRKGGKELAHYFRKDPKRIWDYLYWLRRKQNKMAAHRIYKVSFFDFG